MFELNQQRAYLATLTPHTEKHGDENVQAATLKIEVVMSNAVLNEFDKGLLSALYRQPTKGETSDIEAKNEYQKVRFPLLSPAKWDEEFPGYKLRIDSDIGDAELLSLFDVTLKKFQFEPCDGGSLRITFNANCHPEPSQAGELFSMMQEHVSLTLIAPTAEEQKAAAEKKDAPKKKAAEGQGDILADQDAQDKARADAVGDELDHAA